MYSIIYIYIYIYIYCEFNNNISPCVIINEIFNSRLKVLTLDFDNINFIYLKNDLNNNIIQYTLNYNILDLHKSYYRLYRILIYDNIYNQT